MHTVTSILAQMSETELLNHFETLVARDRRTTAQLLVAIAEIDERKLWARHACPSMFAFCVERFHMSEQVTAKRIWAARTARRFPVVLEMIERGELHLSAIHLLARHLTADNCRDVLQRATHKSAREIERFVAELAPRPDVASRVRALPRTAVETEQGVAAPAASGDATMRKVVDPAQGNAAVASRDATTRSDSAALAASSAPASSPPTSSAPAAAAAGLPSCPVQSRSLSPASAPAARPITALSPRRFRIQITVDEATHDKLRSLQDLLGRSQVGRDPAAIISRAIDSLLMETLKRKTGTTDRPRPARDSFATIDRPKPATTDRPHSACDAPATIDRPRVAPPADRASSKAPQPRTRSIPAALRRRVWQRDCGRCRYTDGRGRRCNATSNVEFHHKNPYAKGGRHEADNVELRCAAHNQYQADLDFGRAFMDARRSGSSRS
jgi:5-methylcytosine-specific restriction endonuclease McrA